MNYLIQIFNLNRLYDRRTVKGLLVDGFGTGFIIFVLFDIISNLQQIDESMTGILIVIAIILSLIYFAQEIVHYVVIDKIIKLRNYTSYTADIKSGFLSQFIHSAFNSQLTFYDSVMYIKESPELAIFDTRYDRYRRTKYGRYKSGEAYYTVIEYKLPRQLPHLMFDSKHAKGRQFKLSFANSQKLDLEGNFAEYFDLYSPQYYQIDTLSFITPEVMELMIDNSDYDIEIKGDSLMLFAPLLNNQQIEEFEARTKNLQAELVHNLKNYRDDRLDKLIGKEKVTDFGASLLSNPNKYLPIILISGIASLGIIYYGLTVSLEVLFNEFSMMVIIVLILYIIAYFKVLNKNRKAEAQFIKNYHKPKQ